ncbi:carboxylesterase [Blastomyces gilchristii SLH14081]|uniref:Carboxylesterase n=1 Tax=Blastomyces gilchristii (strain SLH14081) TaxID=559298 RepID=A0A179V1M9_BLAGS|nr:carboxylesterase [Blastomyces gilchristii SLH14081]OAT13307.1 carboxylesterase [Blastomyces gilchristii SLH14081]
MNLSLKGIISAVAAIAVESSNTPQGSPWDIFGLWVPREVSCTCRVMFPDASDATFKRIHDLFPVPLNQPVETLARDRVTSALANLLIAAEALELTRDSWNAHGINETLIDTASRL